MSLEEKFWSKVDKVYYPKLKERRERRERE